MRTSLQSLPGKNILNQVGSTTSTIATTILHSEGFSLLILYNNGPVQRENMVIWTIGVHRKSKFINRFSRDLMEFMLNDMDESDGSGYDLTDIIRDQYRLAAREGGFLNYLPRKLRIVYPTPTLAAIDQISIQKVMNDFGLRMTEFNSYERGGNVTEVFVEPVKPISVDQLQKVNRDLSDDLFI